MIIGHREQQYQLEQVLQTYERGTFLLQGSEGLGKFSLVRELALKYSQNTQSELIVIDDDEKTIKLGLSHLLRNVVFLSSGQSKRLILINDAHRLTHEAQAALLKPIEDVLSKTLFFLISHRPFTLFPTLRSRCQIIQFKPLSLETIYNFLGSRFKRADIHSAYQLFPGQLGKMVDWLENKRLTGVALRRILDGRGKNQNLLTQLNLLNQLEKNSNLRECLVYLLATERQKLLAGDRSNIDRLKFLISLYAESEVAFNQGLQLSNLCLNIYG